MKYQITKVFYKSKKVAMFECECLDSKFYKWINVKCFNQKHIPNIELGSVFIPDWAPTKEKYTNKYMVEAVSYKMVMFNCKWLTNNTPEPQIIKDEQEIKQKLLDKITPYLDDDEKLIDWGDE